MRKVHKLSLSLLIMSGGAAIAFFLAEMPKYGSVLQTLIALLIGLYMIKVHQNFGTINEKFRLGLRRNRNDIRNTRREIVEVHHTNVKKVLSSLEALRYSTDTTAQSIQGFGDPADSLTKLIDHEAQQSQAYLQLLALVTPRWAMPPLGRWALDPKSMLHLALLIDEHKPRTVVELGSGSSTIWLSYFLEQHSGQLFSFEHLSKYRDQTLQYLERHRLLDTANVIEAPLETISIEGDVFDWYDVQAFDNIHAIDCLFVDGPPGGTNRWARYPALPLLQDRLSPDALVIIDDADRQDEIELVQRWIQDCPWAEQIDFGVSRLNVFRNFGGK